MEATAGKESTTNLLLDRKETYSKGKPSDKTTPVVRLLAAFLRVAVLALEHAAIADAVAPAGSSRMTAKQESHQHSKLEYMYFQSPFPDHERSGQSGR